MASHPEDIVLDSREIEEALDRLAREIHARHADNADLCLIGIRQGGDAITRRLAGRLGRLTGGTPPKVGFMDITLYRDDWTRVGKRPLVGRTEIGFPVKDKVVLLVDDVLSTGRTVRAALDEITDFGRPGRIELAVLVDRGQRELPIQANYVGTSLTCSPGEVIDVVLAEDGAGSDKVVKRLRR